VIFYYIKFFRQISLKDLNQCPWWPKTIETHKWATLLLWMTFTTMNTHIVVEYLTHTHTHTHFPTATNTPKSTKYGPICRWKRSRTTAICLNTVCNEMHKKKFKLVCDLSNSNRRELESLWVGRFVQKEMRRTNTLLVLEFHEIFTGNKITMSFVGLSCGRDEGFPPERWWINKCWRGEKS